MLAALCPMDTANTTRFDKEVAMRRTLALALAVILVVTAGCSLASVAGAQVAVGTFRYDATAFVVMDNGDVYKSDIANPNYSIDEHQQSPWSLLCNILSAGGPPAPVIGV